MLLRMTKSVRDLVGRWFPGSLKRSGIRSPFSSSAIQSARRNERPPTSGRRIAHWNRNLSGKGPVWRTDHRSSRQFDLLDYMHFIQCGGGISSLLAMDEPPGEETFPCGCRCKAAGGRAPTC